jgi:hypothetical protein
MLKDSMFLLKRRSLVKNLTGNDLNIIQKDVVEGVKLVLQR